MKRYRRMIESNPKFTFQDQKHQKRDALTEHFAKQCYDFERVRNKYLKTLRRNNGKRDRLKLKKLMPTLSEFIDTMVDWTDVWRTDFGDDGFAKVTPCPLKWDPSMNGGNGPVKGALKSRDLSEHEEKWLERHIGILSEVGVVEEVLPSDDWVQQNGLPKCCVIFVVPKKGTPPDDKRMIEDFRNTNDHVQKMFYPLLDIKAAHKRLAGTKFYAVLDALKGYNQFPVTEELSYHLVFVTNKGKMYRMKALPMGFVNSAQWYSFVMNREVLIDLVHEICLAYIDDILVYAENGKDLLERLKLVLAACRAKNVQLNIKKSELFRTVVQWCGRLIQDGGVKLDPETIKSLMAIKEPTNARELQQFVCGLNWCSAWIPKYAEKVAPLAELLEECYQHAGSRKSRAVGKVRIMTPAEERTLSGADLKRTKLWKPVHSQAFERLKTALQKHCTMYAPNDEWDRHILVDASDYSWAMTVTQTEPSQRAKPIEDRDHQILHLMSGKFSGHSKNWHISEKEAYGIFRAVKDANWLMHGKRPILIHTDHRNLVKIFNPYFYDENTKKSTADRLLRWSLVLLGCNYQIEHIDGKRNVLADYLSRNHDSGEEEPHASVCGVKRKYPQIVPKELAAQDDAAVRFRKSRVQPLLNESIWVSEKEVRDLQHAADMAGGQRTLPDNLTERTSAAGEKLQVVGEKLFIPRHGSRDLQARLIVIAHARSGHRGVAVLRQLLEDKFFFEGGIDPIALQQYTRECLHCRPRVSFFRRRPGKLMKATKRNEILHMDYYYVGEGKLFDYVLVMMDNLSQFLMMSNATSPTAEHAATCLLYWKAQHGLRDNTMIVTDNASHFTAEIMKKVNERLRTNHAFSVANTPWTNAHIERPNREIKQLFAALTSEFRLPPEEWHVLTPLVCDVLNNMPRKALTVDGKAHTPLQVFHCFEPAETFSGLAIVAWEGRELTADLTDFCDPESEKSKLVSNLIEKFKNRYAEISERKLLEKTEYEAERAEQFSTLLNFAPGDYVLVARDTEVRQDKLRFKWTGPALIIDMDGNSVAKVRHLFKPKTVKDEVREERVHTSRLAFYSRLWEDRTLEVQKQVMFDMDKFVPEKFLALEHDTESPSGYGILIEWDGFTSDFNSVEPIDGVFEAMPSRVLRWLDRMRKERPQDTQYANEYTRLLKKRERKSSPGSAKKRKRRRRK